jgi:NarL family two-component system response regulator LiaR
MEKIKVVIVDDHAIVRLGMVALVNAQPDMETVGEAKNGRLGVEAALRLEPDVVVMDLMMPVMDGIEATRRLVEALPKAKVLILTTSTVADELAAGLRAGATGVVPKTTSNAELLRAIRSVAAGMRTVTREIEEIIAAEEPAPNLTQHQLDMLSSIVRGLTNADIAKQFGVSENTVRKATSAIFAKLDVANRTEAAAMALRRKLVKD